MAMKDLIGTEHIINQVMKLLDCNPWNDLQGWPADAFKQEYMRLSLSKMKNEVSIREPRRPNKDGSRSRYPICSSRMGSFSTNKEAR